MRTSGVLHFCLFVALVAGCGGEAGASIMVSPGPSGGGSCGTFATTRCLQIDSTREVTVDVVTPFRTESDVAVAPGAPAEVCYCECVCAPGSPIGEAVVTSSDGEEVRYDLGVGPMQCCG